MIQVHPCPRGCGTLHPTRAAATACRCPADPEARVDPRDPKAPTHAEVRAAAGADAKTRREGREIAALARELYPTRIVNLPDAVDAEARAAIAERAARKGSGGDPVTTSRTAPKPTPPPTLKPTQPPTPKPPPPRPQGEGLAFATPAVETDVPIAFAP